METKYSPLYDSAAIAIGNNGFQILKEQKYASQISKTLVHTLNSGLVNVTWVDRLGRIIAESSAGIRQWYPEIGIVEDV